MNMLRVAFLVSTLAFVVMTGTIFFHFVEGWSWLDSYFFTVITLSTVGYGVLVPVTALGKIATTVFIFVGLGIFAVVIQQFGQFTMRKREEHTEWLLALLGNKEGKSMEMDAANEDESPNNDN